MSLEVEFGYGRRVRRDMAQIRAVVEVHKADSVMEDYRFFEEQMQNACAAASDLVSLARGRHVRLTDEVRDYLKYVNTKIRPRC